MRNEVMRNVPHESWVGILRSHIRAWMHSGRLSRETVVDQIVDAYEELYTSQGLNEVRFEPRDSDCDPVSRMKVNAERVFRWLDDQTKDTNLLGANFVLPILLALPEDLRIDCTNALLSAAGLAVHSVTTEGEHLDPIDVLRRVLKEGGDVEQALAGLLDGYDEAELLEAQRQIAEAEHAIKEARTMVEIKLSRLRMTAN